MSKTTKELAEALGVTEQALRSIRHKLRVREHWAPDPEDGRRILWSEAGEAAARSALGLNEPEAAPFDTCDPVPEPTTVSGLVVSGSQPGLPHYPNEHIIRVRLDDGREVFGWVRSSRNFMARTPAGEPMRVNLVDRGGRWELADGRCPRWPGKW